MEGSVITLENITTLVKTLTKKYHVKEIYLFGSYARGEADENSEFYRTIMREKVLVA